MREEKDVADRKKQYKEMTASSCWRRERDMQKTNESMVARVIVIN